MITTGVAGLTAPSFTTLFFTRLLADILSRNQAACTLMLPWVGVVILLPCSTLYHREAG